MYISYNTILFKFHHHVVRMLIKQCMERLKISNVSVSNVDVSNVSNIKYPIGKAIFAVSLPRKLFCATVANVETKSLKSLHILFDTYLDNMLPKFEPNRMVRNYKIRVFFTKKLIFSKPFLKKR